MTPGWAAYWAALAIAALALAYVCTVAGRWRIVAGLLAVAAALWTLAIAASLSR
jgi:hypothetical protein